MEFKPLDYRTRYDIEKGLPGPNLWIPLAIGAIPMGFALPLIGHPFTWLGLLWGMVGALAAFVLGYLFLEVTRSRGIPAGMIGSTTLVGVFFVPMVGLS
jgi:hypothetical protein